ncbi:MAG: hypothetical protein AB7L84_05470, partial [Acidimicrobiia bacterium]
MLVAVVIVGAVLAAIASDGIRVPAQPATVGARSHRKPARRPAPPVIDPAAPTLAVADDHSGAAPPRGPSDEAAPPSSPVDRPGGRRPTHLAAPPSPDPGVPSGTAEPRPAPPSATPPPSPGDRGGVPRPTHLAAPPSPDPEIPSTTAEPR